MHTSPLTGTSVPDGPDIPDVPAHLESIVRSLESYGLVRFSSPAQRDTAWPAPPAGAMAFTVSDNQVWLYRSGAWGPFLPGFVVIDGVTRDQNASWGVRIMSQAVVADPVSTNIMQFTDNVKHDILGEGFTSITFTSSGNRQLAIEGIIRFDGGALVAGSDGTMELYVERVSPNPAQLALLILACPSLSPAGGGTSAVWPFRCYDSPGVGPVTYKLAGRCRIPAIPGSGGTAIRVRAPLVMAVTDVGPLNLIMNP